MKGRSFIPRDSEYVDTMGVGLTFYQSVDPNVGKSISAVDYLNCRSVPGLQDVEVYPILIGPFGGMNTETTDVSARTD